jgi:diaminohydroxyphosphoribosylaminopyrimidine deaminase / 5-amino-6-(5-phosphoribosylamino)uracil reductase
MARALELARAADYRTSPNPMVGAVVVDVAGEAVGEGYHERAGGPHAEAVALAAAGARAHGATVYVTLEPCSHHGRTPPCADALVAAGVRRVVVAMEDPDARNRGRGIDRLRAAGIEVEVGDHAAEARRLNEMFVTHRTLGRPFVTLKWAMTLDGRIATATGDARWVSGEAARAHSHRLRHEHDAILVGVGTVLLDDPELTARHEPGARQPLRVILDSRLRTPASARAAGAHTVIYTTAPGPGNALRERGAEVVRLPSRRRRVPLDRVLADLAGRGVLGVLVEGGAQVHASFVEGRLFDRAVVYVAPKLVGGTRAPSPVAGRGVELMVDALGLEVESVERAGEDVVISARPY